MPFAARGTRKIHYEQLGSGPGLVLVPGLGAGAQLFGTLPRRFARAGFTCAAIDPVGLPPSSPLPEERFDFDEAADDLLAVAEELPGPVTLVGTSLGGKVALRAAARRPEAVHRLVLLCSSAIASARGKRVYRTFELLCSEGSEISMLGELMAPFLFGSTFLDKHSALVDDIIRSMQPTAERGAFMRWQARALQEFDGEQDARSCGIETLCLAGAEDTLTPPAEVERTATVMPNSVYRVIDQAGHSLLLESREAFDVVVDFVRQPAQP